MYHKERSQKYYGDVDRCSLLMYIDVYIFDLKVIFKCHTLDLLLEQGMHNTHIYILPTFIGDKCPNIWCIFMSIFSILDHHSVSFLLLKAQVSNLCVLQLYDYQAAVCTFVQDLYQTRPEGSMPQLYYAPQRPSQTLTNAALNWRLSFADVLVFWLASYSLEARQPSKILKGLTWFNQVYWQQVDNNA